MTTASASSFAIGYSPFFKWVKIIRAVADWHKVSASEAGRIVVEQCYAPAGLSAADRQGITAAVELVENGAEPVPATRLRHLPPRTIVDRNIREWKRQRGWSGKR